ncbi:unnamed protein product [Pleuronectes platessa]|uniref:Uncharacterized protein n=1 Tax=Pleuronectes platessa TaxID=8262 RepID=A0A9N7ZBC7_PLEPL|nr:unnamed protein product [Pleuronectes platessa]
MTTSLDPFDWLRLKDILKSKAYVEYHAHLIPVIFSTWTSCIVNTFNTVTEAFGRWLPQSNCGLFLVPTMWKN